MYIGKGVRYTCEFKPDAAAQAKERGYSVNDVSVSGWGFVLHRCRCRLRRVSRPNLVEASTACFEGNNSLGDSALNWL